MLANNIQKGINLLKPEFSQYVGIDYSGAETPKSSLKGLRVYLAEGNALPVELTPPPSVRKYWTRRGIAEWLVEFLARDMPTLVGIDHGFSFPLRYFEKHGICLIGLHFLTIFSITGQPTKTFMSNSSGTVLPEMALRAWEIPAGVD